MTLYIMNTSIVTLEPTLNRAVISVKRISTEEAKFIVSAASNVVSAVGHEATAQLMSELLGRQIATNRVAVAFKAGDAALCFKLKRRIEEGRVLNLAELKAEEYEWLYMVVHD